MIIFDLDGTLADCEHRRHFVQEPPMWIPSLSKDPLSFSITTNPEWRKFNPDWKSFYEACDQDEPINAVIAVYKYLRYAGMIDSVEIWSGRCESVRKKTEEWLDNHDIYFDLLKMRPVGDSTPDDQLKERWLDEYIDSMWPKLPHSSEVQCGKVFYRKDPIQCVFDDRPKVIRMWRRRGIFVFNCCQHDNEF